MITEFLGCEELVCEALALRHVEEGVWFAQHARLTWIERRDRVREREREKEWVSRERKK